MKYQNNEWMNQYMNEWIDEYLGVKTHSGGRYIYGGKILVYDHNGVKTLSPQMNGITRSKILLYKLIWMQVYMFIQQWIYIEHYELGIDSE